MATIMSNNDFIKKAKLAESLSTLYVMGGFGAPAGYRNNRERYSTNYDYNKKRKDQIYAAPDNCFFFDCIGLIKGILWGFTGDPNKQYGGAVYSSNGVPDTNESGMIAKCSNVSNNFNDILPGEMLYMKGHAGIYIGNGLAIESSPAWQNKVQITAVLNIGIKARYNGRKWEKHGRLPWVKYTDTPAPAGYTYTFSIVKPGDKSDDVLLVQTILRGAGYKGKDKKQLELDGIYGENTGYAIKSFQTASGLTSDGIVGSDTWSMILRR